MWKLERLGRDLRHLVNIVYDLTERDVCRRRPVNKQIAGRAPQDAPQRALSSVQVNDRCVR